MAFKHIYVGHDVKCLTIKITRRMSYKMQELLILRGHMLSRPCFFWWGPFPVGVAIKPRCFETGKACLFDNKSNMTCDTSGAGTSYLSENLSLPLGFNGF